jgi:hypothetical protein
MENLSVLAISNEILKMTRDLLVAYAPLIGLLGGLKFVLEPGRAVVGCDIKASKN